MKETPAWSVKLSKEELYLVAGLLQTGNLIGFEDPFAGYLSVEITERLSCAEASLQERGYLIKQSHGELVLDSSIAAMVKELTTSENILIAFSNHLETSYSCLFHFTSDLLLEQLELPNGDIILTALESFEILHERALIFFALKATPRLQMYPSFTINKKDLLLARRSALEEPGSCAGALKLAGVPGEAIPPFASALKEGQFINSLVVLRRGENEMEYGETLSWLSGSEGVWYANILENKKRTIIEMKSTTYSGLQNKMKRMAEDLNGEVK